MKCSEVIKKLQEIQNEHGDLEVKAYQGAIFPTLDDFFIDDVDNTLYYSR